MYLKSISTNDLPDALQAILGEGAAGLSLNTICRLKRAWQEEYEEWNSRDLSDKNFARAYAGTMFLKFTARKPLS